MFEALAPIIGSVAGGLFGGSSDTEATTTSSPWGGIQPYLIGEGAVPSYLTQQPQVSDVYNSWADRLRSGAPNSWMQAPPPMWQGAGGEASWNPYAGIQPDMGQGQGGFGNISDDVMDFLINAKPTATGGLGRPTSYGPLENNYDLFDKRKQDWYRRQSH